MKVYEIAIWRKKKKVVKQQKTRKSGFYAYGQHRNIKKTT